LADLIESSCELAVGPGFFDLLVSVAADVPPFFDEGPLGSGAVFRGGDGAWASCYGLSWLLDRSRYGGAILITSNRSVGEWGTVFGDAVVATAILDRLLHHSHVVTIRSDSYRLKEKRRSGLLQNTVAVEAKLIEAAKRGVNIAAHLEKTHQRPSYGLVLLPRRTVTFIPG
jgi:hypothetical protein